MTDRLSMAVELTVFVAVRDDITEGQMDAVAEEVRADAADSLEAREVRLGGCYIVG